MTSRHHRLLTTIGGATAAVQVSGVAATAAVQVSGAAAVAICSGSTTASIEGKGSGSVFLYNLWYIAAVTVVVRGECWRGESHIRFSLLCFGKLNTNDA